MKEYFKVTVEGLREGEVDAEDICDLISTFITSGLPAGIEFSVVVVGPWTDTDGVDL